MVVGDPKDKLGERAYRVRLEDEEDVTTLLAKKFSKLRLGADVVADSEEESDEFSDSDEEELSYTQSPVPDDTKCMYYMCLFLLNFVLVLVQN